MQVGGPLSVCVRAGVRGVCMYRCGASYCLTNYKQRERARRGWGRTAAVLAVSLPPCVGVCVCVLPAYAKTTGALHMCQHQSHLPPATCLPLSLPGRHSAPSCKKKKETPQSSRLVPRHRPTRAPARRNAPSHGEKLVALFDEPLAAARGLGGLGSSRRRVGGGGGGVRVEGFAEPRGMRVDASALGGSLLAEGVRAQLAHDSLV